MVKTRYFLKKEKRKKEEQEEKEDGGLELGGMEGMEAKNQRQKKKKCTGKLKRKEKGN